MLFNMKKGNNRGENHIEQQRIKAKVASILKDDICLEQSN